jgi:hypothetical protein
METSNVNIMENENLCELSIPNFKYLTNQSWFYSNIDLQRKLQFIIILGGGQKIVVTEEDFEQHINTLFKNLIFEYFELYINDFWYLTERSWFTRSTNLQLKLYTVCKKGYGDKVNVVAGCFEEHLDELLKSN